MVLVIFDFFVKLVKSSDWREYIECWGDWQNGNDIVFIRKLFKKLFFMNFNFIMLYVNMLFVE